MDLLLTLFVEALGRAHNFKPTSSMDDNQNMSSLMSKIGEDEGALLKAYLECEDDDWKNKIGYSAHAWFLDTMIKARWYMGDDDFETLSRIAGIFMNTNSIVSADSMLIHKILQIFVAYKKPTKPVWSKFLVTEITAKAIASHLMSPGIVLEISMSDLAEFIKSGRLMSWGTSFVDYIRDYAHDLGGEYEVKILQAILAAK
jgi:hypothetical protein